MHQSTHPLSTQFRDFGAFRYCKPELVQRIFSWRMNIPPEPCVTMNNPTAGTTSTRPRNRQKPYARPEQSIRCQPSSSSDIYMDVFESSGPYQDLNMPSTNVKENMRDIRDSQTPRVVIPRSSNDLPDPIRNPLITDCPGDIEEEYYHVILLYNQLQDKKRKVELRYLGQPSVEIMQQLMDVGASIQRIVQCARYIETYSRSRGFNINFGVLYSRDQYHDPPPKQQIYESLEGTIKMPQARAFGEGWKVNPL